MSSLPDKTNKNEKKKHVSLKGLAEYRTAGIKRRSTIIVQHKFSEDFGGRRLSYYSSIQNEGFKYLLGRMSAESIRDLARYLTEMALKEDKEERERLLRNAEALEMLVSRFEKKKIQYIERKSLYIVLFDVEISVFPVDMIEVNGEIKMCFMYLKKDALKGFDVKTIRQVMFEAQKEHNMGLRYDQIIFYDLPRNRMSPMSEPDEGRMNDILAVLKEYSKRWDNTVKPRRPLRTRLNDLPLFPDIASPVQ